MSSGVDKTWAGLALEARHVPEYHDPDKPYPHDTQDPITGFIDIGTTIDGVFVILLRRKAPGLMADIKRAQADAQAQQQQQAEQQQAQQQQQAEQQPPSQPPSQ